LPDIVDKETRSTMMAGIKGKNTKPELIIRRGLHRLGFRFRIHDKRLPGKPDLVFPKYKAVIQVQGCFWHGHDCHLFKWPSTRQDFWRAKISGTKQRDARNLKALEETGWRVLTLWECALKGANPLKIEEVLTSTSSWLKSDERFRSIEGKAKT